MRWNEYRAEEWLFDHLLDDHRYERLEGSEVAPLLLRAFIRFAHSELGIRTELTDVVLTAIESWEPKFQAKASPQTRRGRGGLATRGGGRLSSSMVGLRR